MGYLMTNIYRNLLVFVFLSTTIFSQISAAEFDSQEKIYIDENEFSTDGDAFHIHIGNNVWLHTNTVHRDRTGLFTYERDINHSLNGIQIDYEKHWKCPYCHCYWPMGKPCGNKDCPSRYK